ncbi:hypothetical protein OUZ56_019944 [Daphnia magna]|uniref:Uncharacterized protein n=1 Tax=Daphnia magna TaxID=35525 RepID=A0ABQ9ZD26_9CRUS|nr:hypothetical protein OUZ56_019944 [Daphnia magna]
MLNLRNRKFIMQFYKLDHRQYTECNQPFSVQRVNKASATPIGYWTNVYKIRILFLFLDYRRLSSLRRMLGVSCYCYGCLQQQALLHVRMICYLPQTGHEDLHLATPFVGNLIEKPTACTFHRKKCPWSAFLLGTFVLDMQSTRVNSNLLEASSQELSTPHRNYTIAKVYVYEFLDMICRDRKSPWEASIKLASFIFQRRPLGHMCRDEEG